jgi:hypothetical protein
MSELGQPPVDVAAPEPDDLILWSVTTIIDVLKKPAIEYWIGEQTAVAAIRQQATWRGMLQDCDTDCQHISARNCPAVKWLRDARWRRPKDLLSATDLGTVVHTLAETYALTGQRPDKDQVAQQIRSIGGPGVQIDLEGPVVWAMLDRFDEWLQRFTPTYQATEVVVYSPTYGWAGTADAFLTIDGVRAIVDYKTTREPYDSKGNLKKPYAEVSPQLAAYRHGEFAAVWRARRYEPQKRRYYLLNATERAAAIPVPEVDTGWCIHITPEGCEAYPIRCGDDAYLSYLRIQEAARWALEESKYAVAEYPLTPAGVPA